MGRPPLEPGTFGNIPPPRKLAPKKWEASCRYRRLDGETVRVIREGRNKTEARRSLDAALYDLMGRSAPVAKLRPHNTVSEAADLWIERVEQQRRGTTHETYQRILERHVRPGMGALRLGEVNVPAIETFLDGLRETHYRGKPLSAEVLRKAKTVLKGVMQVAVRHGAVAANPVREIDRIEGGARKPARALTPAERADLLAKLDELAATVPDKAANNRRYRQTVIDADLPDIVRFMLGTGVRIGECLGVRWGDFALADVATASGQQKIPVVNISGNVVRVTGKGLLRHGGKSQTAQRAVPVPAFVVEMLTRRRDGAPDERPVFCAGTLGYRDPRNTSRSLREAREEVDYPWVVSHVFRKTAASEWKRMGLDDRVIADLMGHAQVSMTTDVYFGRRQLHPASVGAMDAAWAAEALPS
jgi:integrase